VSSNTFGGVWDHHADINTGEFELVAAQSVAGNIVEERREEVYVAPPPAPVQYGPGPVVVDVSPSHGPGFPHHHHHGGAPTVEVVNQTTVVRDVSPARSLSSYSTSTYTPVVVRDREVSNEVVIGPLALAERRRSRSRSRAGRDIRAEIRALESELKDRKRVDKDIVRVERLSGGEVVLYEERIEKIEEPHRGVRIEKDKKGRMSISVPKYR
jgi:hypothetical protein